ncbi:MFS transporter [Rathayibacter soli]|uniref:MFS transporter n=1 Tax=Rathayibacter soli TaxID=3144168 RepID=UPI0027E544B0|nr:MFS transporter [Glaciibacter superstes]
MTIRAEQSRARVRWIALIVLCAGQLMIVIDQNIVTVALPTLQHSLGFSEASLVWVVNAYAIPFGGLLLLSGRLGDVVGHRAIFLLGIALFGVASFLCGFATTKAMLIVFRFIQGVGGAAASACILGMVATMFTARRQRAKAIGVYSFASAGGGAVGPLLGGVLTGLVSWNWIFWINVPIGATVIILALRVVPKGTERGSIRRADFLGALLVTTGIMLTVFTISDGGNIGWGSAQTLALALVCALLLTGFLVREANTRDPLLPLSMFRSRTLSAANLVQFLVIASMFGLLYFGTLYLQQVLGFNPLQAGLAFVPIAIVIAAVSLGLSSRFIGRVGQRPTLIIGLALISIAFILLCFTRPDGAYLVEFLLASLAIGLGFGLAAPAISGLGMASVDPSRSGVASGLLNTTQQMGGAVGLAVLSAVVTARTASLEVAGNSHAESLDGAYHAAFFIAAALVVCALVVALGLPRNTTTAHVADRSTAWL